MSPTAGENEEEPSAGPTARRILLGALLKRLRERANVDRTSAAYEIRGSDSKMSRLESGKVGFKIRDVEDLLTMYGVTDGPERERVLEMARRTNESGWWQRYNDAVPGWFEDFIGLEGVASRIQDYELLFVPGLLQTPEYARAIVSGGSANGVDPAVENRLEVRLRRQRALHRRDAPTYWTVIDEAVFSRPVGGPQVFARQIDHLLDLASLPTIVLQILPRALSGYAVEHAFTILRFAEAELPTLVYLEELTGATYLDRRVDVESYLRAMDRIAVDALTPEQSRKFLNELRAER